MGNVLPAFVLLAMPDALKQALRLLQLRVGLALQHGGPYPATTDSRTTSVGTAAIERFVRPISYQNFPQEALPEELRNENPRKIWRLVDSKWSNAPVE